MDSSTLVLTENLINPDGSRARHQGHPAERTGIASSSGLAQEGLETSEVHAPNTVASARGTRPKSLYVLMAAALSARSGLSSRLGLLFCRWQVP